MRILFVTSYYEPAFVYGGPVRCISVMCQALVRAGVEMTVFTTNANGKTTLDVPIGERVELGGVRVYYFGREPGLLPFYSRGLERAVTQRAQEFELVHSSTLWGHAMWPTSAACRRWHIPRIEWTHGALMPWCLHHKYWKKWPYFTLFVRPQLNRAAAIHCTDETERQAIKSLGLRPPIFVVPNPLELGEFSAPPASGSLRSELGLPADSLVTLFLGRMVATKALDLTARAFVEVAARHANAHLVLAGPEEDGSGEQARRLVGEAGLQDRVHFVGIVAGTRRLSALVDADLFIMNSHSESFGLAAAEAMAVGLPVLLSDQVGIARHVAQAGAGAVVPLDVSCIAQTWSALLDNPLELKAMGARGRELAQREYDADAVARKMLDVYHRVIQDWSTARSRKRTKNLIHHSR